MTKSTNKNVRAYDNYTFKGTEYLEVKTRDGWLYRFCRPDESVPFQAERRQRPDGTWADRDDRLPDDVVNWLEDSRFDASDLHGRPSSLRRDDPEEGTRDA